MSDTPRTDQIEKLAYWFNDDMTAVCESRFTRNLERELNASNERIKRLEEALESIQEYWNRDNTNRAMEDACWHSINTASEALKAKESKP